MKGLFMGTMQVDTSSSGETGRKGRLERFRGWTRRKDGAFLHSPHSFSAKGTISFQ